MLGSRKDCRRSASLLHFAALQHHDAVGDLGDDRKIVGDIDTRDPARPHDRLECAQHLDLRRHVECRRRLVEDDELRIADQRHGRGQPLQLSARNLVRITSADRLWIRQRQGPEELDRAGSCLVGRHKVVDPRNLDHLLHDCCAGLKEAAALCGT